MAVEEPGTTPLTALVALPPGPTDGATRPPGPPLPPTTVPLMLLTALPEAPDCEAADELEPELAPAVALAVAEDGPLPLLGPVASGVAVALAVAGGSVPVVVVAMVVLVVTLGGVD